MAVLTSPPSTPSLASSRPRGADISLLNLAARQRMLSQRLILQTVLAAQGNAQQLEAARRSLALFSDSQARLMDTPRVLETGSANHIRQAYRGPEGVGPTIDAFAEQVRNTLDLIDRQSPRVEASVATLVDSTDQVLEALNTATSAFDHVTKAQSESLMRELSQIVSSIQTVAREAKVVSFNAQVMAARAGQHGREFAVVANVLSGITSEIDSLSLKAVSLAGRSRLAG